MVFDKAIPVLVLLELKTKLTAPIAIRKYSHTEIQRTKKSEDKYIYFMGIYMQILK
jgi:hypothetical protein